MRFTTNGVCSKTYNHIYVARTNEDLKPYICNVCEFLGTDYCMPTLWLTGPLQKSPLPGSNLWLRHWLWGGTFRLAPGRHFPMLEPCPRVWISFHQTGEWRRSLCGVGMNFLRYAWPTTLFAVAYCILRNGEVGHANDTSLYFGLKRSIALCYVLINEAFSFFETVT